MTITRGRWFPASVVAPDLDRPLRRVYVVLAEGFGEDGLHAWLRPGDVADHRWPVDWASTPPVPVGRAARGGITVALDGGGIAVVTIGAGCRCGALGSWAGPIWAGTVATR